MGSETRLVAVTCVTELRGDNSVVVGETDVTGNDSHDVIAQGCSAADVIVEVAGM